MCLSTNKQKIQELFNNMQKAITNFDELIFTHEYIAFDIYKIHIDVFLINIEEHQNYHCLYLGISSKMKKISCI